MKKLFRILFIAAAILLSIACEKKPKEDPDKVWIKAEYPSILRTVVRFYGTVNADLKNAGITDSYFLVSEDSSFPETKTKRVNFKAWQNDLVYFGETADLEFDKKFYFKAVAESGSSKYESKALDFFHEYVPVSKITLDHQQYLVTLGGGIFILNVTVEPDNATRPLDITFTSSDESVLTVLKAEAPGEVYCQLQLKSRGWSTVTAKSVDGTQATCKVKVRGKCPDGAVDLGLSTFWATANLGATGTGNGNYYAWGETSPRTSFNATYGLKPKDYPNGLPKSKDAASTKLGGYWRMPTYEEVAELCQNCDFSLDGTNGIILKSRINNKTIFFPFNGYYDPYDNYKNTTVGRYVAVWTGTAAPGYTSLASILYGWSVEGGGISTDKMMPTGGLGIRPVSD